jgi:hypothetical protein
MHSELLAFQTNLDQLHAFFDDGASQLVMEEGLSGHTRFHCIEAEFGLSLSERINEAGREALASYLSDSARLFDGSEASLEILRKLQWHFDGEVKDVAERIYIDVVGQSNPSIVGKRQDVCIRVTESDGTEGKRWAHAHLLKDRSQYFADIFDLDPARNSDGCYMLNFTEVPAEVVEVSLMLLYNVDYKMPRDVEQLASIYIYAQQIEQYTGCQGLRESCLKRLKQVLDGQNIQHLLPILSKADSELDAPLYSVVIRKAAQDFDLLMRCGGGTGLTHSLLTEILQSPELAVDEHSIIEHCIRWTEAQTNSAERAQAIWLAGDKGQRLCDLLRFEHLSLSEFVKLMGGRQYLTDECFTKWVEWLGGPPKLEQPRRPSRIPMQVTYSEDGTSVNLHLSLPVRRFLLRGHHHGYSVEEGYRTNSFVVGGERYHLEFVRLPMGHVQLALRRYCTKGTAYTIPIRWSCHYPATKEWWSSTCHFSPGRTVDYTSGMSWQWLNRLDPASGRLAVDVTIHS